MFKFKLPHGAVVEFIKPDGQKQVMVYDEAGYFHSPLPPVVVLGVSRDHVEHSLEKLPVEWDHKTFPLEDMEHSTCNFYDGAMAVRAVEAAAAAGESYAQKVVADLAQADAMIAARDALAAKE